MSEAPETLRLARMWIERAEEDLFVAERLLSPEESCPFSAICFHAQKSVASSLIINRLRARGPSPSPVLQSMRPTIGV